MRENKKKQTLEKYKSFMMLGGLVLGNGIGTILIYLTQGVWNFAFLLASALFAIVGSAVIIL